MICPVCKRREFLGTSSVVINDPALSSGDEALARVRVRVEMIFTCRTCGQQLSGEATATIACRLDTAVIPYPLRMYEFVRKSYGDGWNVRSRGRRLKKEESANISMARGWGDAHNHSNARGGGPPAKGWGHNISNEYLKSDTACHHLKMISLSELLT